MKRLLTILLIGWMVIIFILSSENSNSSTIRTNSLTRKVIEIGLKVSHQKLSEKEIKKVQKNIFMITRKIAHITEYFILGILMLLRLSKSEMFNKKVLLWSILFCFLYASTDEVHQLFVVGRSGKIIDVFIDSIGFISSSILTYLLIIKKNDKKSLRHP